MENMLATRMVGQELDNRKSIKEVLKSLEEQYGLKHRRLANKRILFELLIPKNEERAFLWMPESKIYSDGRAWVDLNELQKIEGARYHKRIGIIRLGDGNLAYINLEDLNRYLTQNTRKHNSREGNFWRLYIWHRKSTPYVEICGKVGEGAKRMSIQVNNDGLIKKHLANSRNLP